MVKVTIRLPAPGSSPIPAVAIVLDQPLDPEAPEPPDGTLRTRVGNAGVWSR
jgi:hypothetical protein